MFQCSDDPLHVLRENLETTFKLETTGLRLFYRMGKAKLIRYSEAPF